MNNNAYSTRAANVDTHPGTPDLPRHRRPSAEVQEERHLVALLCSGDGDEALVAVVGGFVDLDDAAAQLPNFVDFSTALTDDSSDHIVRNIDLLCKRL